LERDVHKRILDYINNSCIFFNNQYGFRKKHSTSLALMHLCQKKTSAIDRKEFTIGIFLDLSKAFDTIDLKFYLIDLGIMASEEWRLHG
jgi:hypothetical protein